MSSCKKTEKTPPTEPAGSAGSAATATPPAAPKAEPATQTPPGATGNTAVVPAATLAAITLPAPKGAPAKGAWSSATAVEDGDRLVNFVDGDDIWVSVQFLDCNLPMVKETAGKPGGEFSYCFDASATKLKGYPLFKTSDTQRVVKVGHLAVLASLGVTGETKLTAADLEAFLESLDLASLAKL